SWSADIEARAAGAGLLAAPENPCRAVLDSDLEEALLAARMVAYGQGMALLQAASDEYAWSLDLARTAEIWRAGCIIRSALLDDIAAAIRKGLPHGQLIFTARFADRLGAYIPALRRVVTTGLTAGLPMPAMAAALGYYDTMRAARGTTDLIQAQRDFFGAHGFERRDMD
ncbi:MAG: NADP-dependent phosphogluconate dehydrogenase, partial [Pseudomonadota bacterium]